MCYNYQYIQNITCCIFTVHEDIDGKPLEIKKEPEKPKFVASKWESVDEDTVKAQG